MQHLQTVSVGNVLSYIPTEDSFRPRCITAPARRGDCNIEPSEGALRHLITARGSHSSSSFNHPLFITPPPLSPGLMATNRVRVSQQYLQYNQRLHKAVVEETKW